MSIAGAASIEGHQESRRRRTLTFATLVMVGLQLPGSAALADHGHDVDCGDFVYQEDAQDHLNRHPGDPDGLDSDDDGVACESLPHRPVTPLPPPPPPLPPPPAPADPCRASALVQGAIRDRYVSLGGPCGFLRLPLTGELSTPGNVGRFNVFQGGSIYWSPATGAWEVHGGIRDRWAAIGWEGGPVGFPITNEVALRNGAFNAFQAGSIYWSPTTGAHAVLGDIRKTWSALGWENSALGYPVTSELPTPGTPGAFNHFQQGSIYWSPETGAHEVRGLIREEWARLGWEASLLGFPLSNEYAAPEGRRSDFENGSMTWNPTTGVVVQINGEAAQLGVQSP